MYNNSDDLQRFAVLVEMFRSLASYAKASILENKRSGIPLQRPLVLHYEDDPAVYEIQYEYLYGRDLLVAPVSAPGVVEWKIYLPRDTWVYLYDGTELEGPQERVVPAPLGRIPVFYRKDSLWTNAFKELAAIAVNGLTASVSHVTLQCDKESCDNVEQIP